MQVPCNAWGAEGIDSVLWPQVVPASVRSVPPDGAAEQPQGVAQQNGNTLSEASPRPVVENGCITYWPGFEALLHYALYQEVQFLQVCQHACMSHQLKLDGMQLGWQIGEEGSVIMSEPLFTSRVSKIAVFQSLCMQQAYWHMLVQADREQLTQLAFEEFNMTGFFLCDQPVLSLYAVGKITGTVVDLGHSKTGMQQFKTPLDYAAG